MSGELPFTGFVIPGGSGGGGNVTGPGSATEDNLASFGSTSGTVLEDSGIAKANVVQHASTSTDNAIARYDGAGGKTLQDSAATVADTTGTVTNAGQYLARTTQDFSLPQFSFSGDPNTGVAWRQADALSLVVGAGEYLRCSSGVVLAPDSSVPLTSNAGFKSASNKQYAFSATTDATAALDAGLGRSAAGVVKVTDGSTGIRGFHGGGAAVASAAAMPVPTGRVFHVTGTDNITSITSTNFQAGAVITLIFDDVLTFTDGNNLKLAGNFVTSADDTITLAYDGTNWYECSRSVN